MDGRIYLTKKRNRLSRFIFLKLLRGIFKGVLPDTFSWSAGHPAAMWYSLLTKRIYLNYIPASVSATLDDLCAFHIIPSINHETLHSVLDHHRSELPFRNPEDIIHAFETTTSFMPLSNVGEYLPTQTTKEVRGNDGTLHIRTFFFEGKRIPVYSD